MRTFLESLQADRPNEEIVLYVFTTHGHVYVGVYQQITDDVVEMLAVDRKTPLYLQLADVSGIRLYDGSEEI